MGRSALLLEDAVDVCSYRRHMELVSIPFLRCQHNSAWSLVLLAKHERRLEQKLSCNVRGYRPCVFRLGVSTAVAERRGCSGIGNHDVLKPVRGQGGPCDSTWRPGIAATVTPVQRRQAAARPSTPSSNPAEPSPDGFRPPEDPPRRPARRSRYAPLPSSAPPNRRKTAPVAKSAHPSAAAFRRAEHYPAHRPCRSPDSRQREIILVGTYR